MQKNRHHRVLENLFFLTWLMLILFVQSANAQTQSAAVQGLLWEVKASQNSTPVYLYGSIHLGTQEFFPLATAIENAFQQASDLVVEADISNEENNKAIIPILSYTPPDNLENHLKPATWDAFRSLINIGVEDTKKLRPALLSSAFTVAAANQAGFFSEYGIDHYFLDRVKKGEKKRIIELEGIIFQGKLLANLTDEEGDELLAQTIAELKTGRIVQEVIELANAWRQGDEKALVNIFNETANKDAGSKKLLKLLVNDRNVSMADKIQQLAHQETKAFVVIGAGHLVGTDSVVDLLQKKGLQLKRIQ